MGAFERVTSGRSARTVRSLTTAESPARTGPPRTTGAPGVAWWAVYSAALAPAVLVGGWIVAGAQQPDTYNPIRQSISVLAGDGAADRWIMTACLFVVGCCHLVTASGLRPLRPSARWVLALGGLLGIGVAMFPEPVDGATAGHLASAIAGAVVMTMWPLLTASRAWPWPSALSPPVVTVVTLVFLTLAGWLALEALYGTAFGLAERVVTAAETVWPLVVVLALVRAAREESIGAQSPGE